MSVVSMLACTYKAIFSEMYSEYIVSTTTLHMLMAHSFPDMFGSAGVCNKGTIREAVLEDFVAETWCPQQETTNCCSCYFR